MYINTYRDSILFGLALVGAVIFFATYPSHEPRSAIAPLPDQDTVQLEAVDLFNDFGYSADGYTAEVTFEANDNLLDSLQHKMGRTEAIRMLKDAPEVNIKPFYWSVVFEKETDAFETDESEEVEAEGEGPPGESESDISLRLDEKRRFMELRNPDGILPVRQVNRQALGAVFNIEEGAETPFGTLSDSLLGRLLYFDLQQENGEEAMGAEVVSEHLRNGQPYRYTSVEAENLARYYLDRSGWDASALMRDTVRIQRVQSVNAASVRFRHEGGVKQQELLLDVTVAPTGSLISMNPRYNPRANPDEGWGLFSAISRVVLVFFFCLAGVVIFFFRIRSRAIDTRSALVVAVIMGLMVPVYMFLNALDSIELFGGSEERIETILLFVQMGIAGAIASLAYFVLFAISDSITRQHWAEKLATYDYLRQGMLFNKPLGLVMVHSVFLAFALAGLWTSVLYLFPELYIGFDMTFLDGNVGWPPLFITLKSAWFSFAFLLGAFLVVGNLAYARFGKKWIAGMFMVVSSAIIVPLQTPIGPLLPEFLLGLILGVALVVIYLRWDFLTVFLSHVFFLGLVGTASGWLVPGSPDLYVFVTFLVFLAFVFTTGVTAVFKGKEEKVLPKYIPEYVEELAQEERIKQELQIARQVQQSFLPEQTPDIKGLDIAAHCQPAYETGGDYYDFIRLDDHRIAVTIGDVSGKGIQAAFYMTFTKGILHTLCRETYSPAELLIKANRLFCDNARKGTFISLVYGIIDLKRKTFTFARAGHNPIIRLKGGSGHIEELQPVGLGIGLTKDQSFDRNIKEIELTLTDDDVLVLYTDGIVEALNENHQFYGNKKLISLLKNERKKPASEILSLLSDNVRDFIGSAKQHDDMTVMVIKLSNDHAGDAVSIEGDSSSVEVN